MKTLYVYKQSGCGACEEAEKHLQEWQRGKWGKCLVVRLNTTLKDWSVTGYSPRGTPAYLVVDEKNRRLAKHEGVLTGDEIDDLMSKAEAEAA